MKNYFRFVVFALLGLMSTQWASAQIVTISPTTGNLIGAQGVDAGGAGSTEVGIQAGFLSQWRHKQLPLSFTTSDYTDLTSFGQFATPANNMVATTETTDGVQTSYLNIVCAGEGFFSLVLPRGYRFTGYRITFKDQYSGKFQDAFTINRNNWSFREMDANFTTSLNGEGLQFTNSTPQNDLYTLTRTSDDMSNVLYFRLGGGTSSGGLTIAALKIQYFEVTFEVDQHFTATVQPTDEFYERVTAPNQLSAGDQVLIVYNNGSTNLVMGRQPGGFDSYRTAQPVTVTNNQIVLKSTNMLPSRFTLGGSSGAWTLYSETNTLGYLANDDGTLVTQPTSTNFNITFNNNNARIYNSRYNTSYYISHTSSNSLAHYFNLSTSAPNNIQLWKRVAKVDATAVSLAESPFATGRLDVGEIGYVSGSGDYGTYKATVYNYTNVKDLYGNIQLYNKKDGDDDKIANNSSADGKTIKPAVKDGQYYYQLQTGTYYIETPTTAKDQSGKDVPLGYRITGVKVHFTK